MSFFLDRVSKLLKFGMSGKVRLELDHVRKMLEVHFGPNMGQLELPKASDVEIVEQVFSSVVICGTTLQETRIATENTAH